MAGCLLYRSDSKVAALEVSPATLTDFADTYWDVAHYKSSDGGTGFGGGASTLSASLGFLSRNSGPSIRVEISENEISVFQENAAAANRRYRRGADYEFRDNQIYFSDRTSKGAEAGGIGYSKETMRWALDRERRLVVIHGGSGAGLLLGVPVVAGGNSMSIFQRVSDGPLRIAEQAPLPSEIKPQRMGPAATR